MGWIKISKKSFFHNLDIITKRAGSTSKIALVLKDNAYGHGLLEIASLAKEYGIKRCVVRNIDEAKRIEKFFDYILILADIPQKLMDFNFAVNDLKDLRAFPKKSKIELKIDTGMHRSGILPSQIKEAFKIIKKRDLDLRGVFTHFRSADELSSELFWQDKIFDEVKKEVFKLCNEYNFNIPHFHSCNSAALFRFKKLKDDFARVGIAAYGYLEFDEVFDLPKLKPVLSLWANKISSRVLKKGQRVGYGGVYEAEYDMVVSTYDIGYADGFFRTKNYILPGGEKILGRVSMDNMSINSQKQEICIIDDARITAKFFGTITYEILVKLSPFLKREII